MDASIPARLLNATRDFLDARHLVDVPGLSSARVCRFLNALVAELPPDEIYLEVGTWQGRTLLSAAHGNFGKVCVGCDKFRLWGRFTGFGPSVKRALARNMARYRRHGAVVRFHAMTSERLFAENCVPGKVGVYFYDGDHSFDGTRRGIVDALPYLARSSVLLVDDWNDPTIRKGARVALDESGLRVVWERSLEGDHSENGFWNGLGVFALERR